MMKVLRCSGFVVGGVLIGGGLFAGIFGLIASAVYGAVFTVSRLGLPEPMIPLLAVPYLTAIVGGILGAIHCWKTR